MQKPIDTLLNYEKYMKKHQQLTSGFTQAGVQSRLTQSR